MPGLEFGCGERSGGKHATYSLFIIGGGHFEYGREWCLYLLQCPSDDASVSGQSRNGEEEHDEVMPSSTLNEHDELLRQKMQCVVIY